jgi:hypothetical protein
VVDEISSAKQAHLPTLAKPAGGWDDPSVNAATTLKADDRRRVLLPGIEPGERFDYTLDSEGRIILRRLKPVPEVAERPARLIKLKRDGEGRLRVPSSVRVSRDEIVRSVREERHRR